MLFAAYCAVYCMHPIALQRIPLALHLLLSVLQRCGLPATACIHLHTVVYGVHDGVGSHTAAAWYCYGHITILFHRVNTCSVIL
jgi:hypothetical protein